MEQKAVIRLLKDRLIEQTQSDIAREIGVSPQYISDVLKGDKPPSDRVLEYLGLRRVSDIVRAK